MECLEFLPPIPLETRFAYSNMECSMSTSTAGGGFVAESLGEGVITQADTLG
jgi:hypothetical protein